MDLKKILDGLLSDVDMRSEIARRKAYIRCIEYADEHVDYDQYNLFLAEAADRLGQVRLMRDILSTKLRPTQRERIHVRFDDAEGCQIIANPEGALYMARAFRALSSAKLVGEHIHFYYGEPPLVGDSYPVVMYLEDDAYFDDTDEDGIIGSPSEWQIEKRDIDPSEIAGFFVGDYMPEQLFISINKVYPVLSWEWLMPGMQVWKKEIRDNSDRMIVLTFRRDDGEIQQIAIDLDDDMFGFVTFADLKKMLWRDERG